MVFTTDGVRKEGFQGNRVKMEGIGVEKEGCPWPSKVVGVGARVEDHRSPEEMGRLEPGWEWPDVSPDRPRKSTSPCRWGLLDVNGPVLFGSNHIG